MAAAQQLWTANAIPAGDNRACRGTREQRRGWIGTPEIYFPKPIDNSRLKRVADPRRAREMRMFSMSLALLFLVVMTYAWQHFSAIEYGYQVENVRAQRDAMLEQNRALRLEEASLRDPERIDTLARQMGLKSPDAGQVQRLEGDAVDSDAPVLARAADVLVVSMAR